MRTTLDIRNEGLTYLGNFTRPTLELWGAGGIIVKHIHDALSAYRVSLQNFQLSTGLSTAADTVLTVHIKNTVLKFSFEKIEVSFTGFTEEEFQNIPSFLQSSTGWLSKIVPDFSFASHDIQYFSHSFLKEGSVDDFLRNTPSRTLKSAGFDLGTGTIFHRSVPDRKWVTRLMLDRSQFIPGALFVGLSIRIETGPVDYQSLLMQGRGYFQESIGELGLSLADPA